MECPANCGCVFDTTKSLNSHLSQSQKCAWYQEYEKTAALDKLLQMEIQEEQLGGEFMQRQDEYQEELGEQAAEILQEFEEENDIFHFVHLEEEEEIGEAGSGPITKEYRSKLLERQLGVKLRVLDDEEGETQVVEEDPNAGFLVRMDPSLCDH
ncbi:hypothetical protein BT96DRAFT_996024 [Gymnopus androsaceus JB14]|uniref:Uncharacterized protein n=1 Tax=Gymnopus androsaceus JB14 TaxID=1447944 RepID=A0A6A4HJA9_9AGAR|nr:hypothetical protein BT96DRAFT_996024 [Gymnopus androsaceus JB14]